MVPPQGSSHTSEGMTGPSTPGPNTLGMLKYGDHCEWPPLHRVGPSWWLVSETTGNRADVGLG